MNAKFMLPVLLLAGFGVFALADAAGAHEIPVADYTVKTEMIVSNDVRLAVSTPTILSSPSGRWDCCCW